MCARAYTHTESGGYGGRDDSVDRTRRSHPSLTVPCAVERKLGDRSVSRKSHYKQLEAFGHVIMYKQDSHLSCHRDLRGKMHVTDSTIVCTADGLSSAPSPPPPQSSVQGVYFSTWSLCPLVYERSYPKMTSFRCRCTHLVEFGCKG